MNVYEESPIFILICIHCSSGWRVWSIRCGSDVRHIWCWGFLADPELNILQTAPLKHTKNEPVTRWQICLRLRWRVVDTRTQMTDLYTEALVSRKAGFKEPTGSFVVIISRTEKNIDECCKQILAKKHFIFPPRLHKSRQTQMGLTAHLKSIHHLKHNCQLGK